MNQESPQPDLADQPADPVFTGSDYRHLADFIEEITRQWQEHSHNSVLLLKALAELSRDNPTRAPEGFEPVEIMEQIGARLDTQAEDKTEAGTWVRKRWSELNKLWPNKLEGMRQTAQRKRLRWIPDLKKVDGPKGSNRPRRHILFASPFPAVTAAPLVSTDDDATTGDPVATSPPPHNDKPAQSAKERSPEFDVEYICEDLINPRWAGRVFASGLQMKGGTVAIFIGLFVILWLSGLLALLLVIVILPKAPTAVAAFTFLLHMGVIGFFIWKSFAPLYLAAEKRILPAPWWLRVFDDDRLLEWRCPPRYEHRLLLATRYVGTCPRCGGRVRVFSGGWSFPGRLVGRCEESPSEHVYSFDHIERRGKPLR